MGVTLPRLLPSEIRRMQAPIQKHRCKRAARAGSNLLPGRPSEMLQKKELVTPSSLARCHQAASSQGCVEPAKEHSPSKTASCWRHCPGFSFGGPEQGMPRRGFKHNRLENVTPPFPSQAPTPVSQEHGLLVQAQSSWGTALARRCFMLALDVISSAVRTGHQEKPGIYCSSHNFLATSLLSPPPACCREIKFQ